MHVMPFEPEYPMLHLQSVCSALPARDCDGPVVTDTHVDRRVGPEEHALVRLVHLAVLLLVVFDALCYN